MVLNQVGTRFADWRAGGATVTRNLLGGAVPTSSIIQAIRYSARQLWSNPAFTVAALLCIALGVGANAVVFSYTNALLFQVPDVEGSDRLVRLFMGESESSRFGPFSYKNVVDVRDKCDAFTSAVAETVLPCNPNAGDYRERISGSNP